MKKLQKIISLLIIIMIFFQIFSVTIIADDAINGKIYFIVSKYSYYEITATSSNVVAINYELNNSSRLSNSKWVLVADGDYFRIKNYNSEKYLQVNYDTCSSTYTCSLKDSSSSSYQRWSITRNADGSFYIKMKSNSSKYLTFIMNGRYPSLVVSGSSGNNSKWKLDFTNQKKSICTVACKNDSYRDIIDDYYYYNELLLFNRTFSPVTRKDNISTSSQVFNEMGKHDIVIFDGHGKHSSESGGAQTFGDQYNTTQRRINGFQVNQITDSYKFKDVKLVYYRGCGAAYYDGGGVSKPLLEETVNKGASLAIGYKDTVSLHHEEYFFYRLFYYTASTPIGYTINKALSLTERDFYIDNPLSDSTADIPNIYETYGDIYQQLY